MALLNTVSTSAGSMAYTPTSSVTTMLREDLYPIVTNVDPKATQVLDLLGTGGTIASPIYQWGADSLPSIVLNAVSGEVDVNGINAQGILEGFDGTSTSTYPYTGQPERLTNFIQMFAAKVQISDTLKNAQPTGIQDPYNWEKVKATVVIKKAMERRLFDNASANASYQTGSAGSSTNPYRMKGLFEWTSGNYTINQVTANAQLNATFVDQIMEATVTAGGDPRILAVQVGSKIDLSGSLRNTSSQYINASNIAAVEKKIIKSVDVYEGDYGEVAVVWTRQIPTSSSTTGGGKAWAIEPQKIQFGFYSQVQHIPLAKTGHNTKGIIVGEVGYRLLNPKAIGVLNGVTT